MRNGWNRIQSAKMTVVEATARGVAKDVNAGNVTEIAEDAEDARGVVTEKDHGPLCDCQRLTASSTRTTSILKLL